MMGLPAGTRIWIVAGVTDLWRGFVGLAGMVQTALEEDPFSGHVFMFRGRRGNLIKVLWWDSDGMCLLAKRLERGRFICLQAESGTVSLTRAQLSMLLEGIDWRRPARTAAPDGSVSSNRFFLHKFFRRCELFVRFFLAPKRFSGILCAR